MHTVHHHKTHAFNRFGEAIYKVAFVELADAGRFTKMVGANPRCFALIGTRREQGAWVVAYRARKASPWKRDPRARKE